MGKLKLLDTLIRQCTGSERASFIRLYSGIAERAGVKPTIQNIVRAMDDRHVEAVTERMEMTISMRKPEELYDFRVDEDVLRENSEKIEELSAELDNIEKKHAQKALSWQNEVLQDILKKVPANRIKVIRKNSLDKDAAKLILEISEPVITIEEEGL